MFVFQNRQDFHVFIFQRLNLICVFIIWKYGQSLIFCILFSGSLFLISYACFYISFLHSPIMWLTITYLSVFNHPLLLYCVLSVFTLI